MNKVESLIKDINGAIEIVNNRCDIVLNDYGYEVVRDGKVLSKHKDKKTADYVRLSLRDPNVKVRVIV